MFARELVALLSLFVATEAIQCNVQGTGIATTSQICPANINQCLKVMCRTSGGGEMITRGCDDPLSPTGCTTISNNCAAQGGSAQCYRCGNFDFCNGATSGSIITAIATLLAVFYATL